MDGNTSGYKGIAEDKEEVFVGLPGVPARASGCSRIDWWKQMARGLISVGRDYQTGIDKSPPVGRSSSPVGAHSALKKLTKKTVSLGRRSDPYLQKRGADADDAGAANGRSS